MIAPILFLYHFDHSIFLFARLAVYSLIPPAANMHLSNTVIASCLLAADLIAAIPTPTYSTHSLHEKRSAPPALWAKRDRVLPDIILPVRIGMTQSNLDKGATLLDEV